MRNIKFRAWDKKREKMFNITALFPYEKMVRYREELPDIYNYLYENECILMQFTNLLDKNGKEIYEGDIIKCGEHKGEVKWNGIRLDPFDYISGLDMVHGATSRWTKDGTEVIGNIYENKELLKKEKEVK